MNHISNTRLYCPKCGKRQTALVDGRDDVDKWECLICRIKFYVLGQTVTQQEDTPK